MRVWMLAVLVGCGGKDLEIGDPSGCDPLDEALCALPYPSSMFLEEDSATATGYRVAYGPTTLPVNWDDVPLTPTHWNEKDGFSTSGPLLTYFDDVSIDGVVGHQDLGAYLDDDAKTVIINVETGERVMHFVELDSTAPSADTVLLFLRNVEPFDFDTHYVVGIRDLQTNAGGSVAVSEAFTALRDGTETEDYDIESRRDRFESTVFPALESAGFARGELQLAWDFHTVSRESSLGRVEFMRDDALERVGEQGPPYEVVSTEDFDCSGGGSIARQVDVVMTVPLYTELDGPGTFLTRDEDGYPTYNGDTEVDVRVRIPCSLALDPRPGMLLQYGHGLLGDRGEVETGYLSDMIHEHGWVAFAVDWAGMSSDDVAAVTMMLVSDLSDFGIIPERSMQGLVQGVMAMQLMKGGFASDPSVIYDGVSVIDPDSAGYYGNSQGGIMGGALVGLSPHIERAGLGVGGAPYSMLLSRSLDFDPFFLIFKNKYQDHREVTLLLAAIQQLWDPAESAGWLSSTVSPPEGMHAKDVLLHVGIGDAQVTPLGSHFMARGYGAVLVSPETRPVYGVEVSQPGFSGSAIVEYEYTDVPEVPVENIPPESADYDTHECPRREASAHQQLFDFLETGVVNHYCDGICQGLREDVCG